MRVAIILVHYRTPELLREALAAVAATTSGLGLDLETIVVDNGCDPDRHSLLDGLDALVIRPDANLGYAGGLNLGASRSRAEALVLMNPDVLVGERCVTRLLEALRSGAAAAGPRFWWDRGQTLLLPPTERRALRDELWRALAERGPNTARRARHRWRTHARRHWEARESVPSYDLSGAMLAVTRAAWSRVGPFDDAFRLYFEETDWLLRLRAAGLTAVHEPRAEAIHLYARSSATEPSATAWFAESQERFRRRHHGRVARWLLARAEAPRATGRHAEWQRADAAASNWALPVPERGGAVEWVEVSASPIGFPAAAARLAAGTEAWTLPDEVRDQLAPAGCVLRAVTTDGREVGELLPLRA